MVAKVRRLAHERSIGHLGTLDPLATGVLPLIAGRATRLARFFTANDKRYDAIVQFGVSTDSYDRDGQVTASAPDFLLESEHLEQALHAFRGTFLQTPPAVSAKKINGVPAYKLARQKIEVELKPAEVTVFSLELIELDGLRARLLIHCGGGTYVRSIAHDLGQKLGCGGIVDSLRRISSGDFTIDQSHTMQSLQALSESDDFQQAVIPAASLLPQFPSERVDATTAGQIRQGRDFRVSPFRTRPDTRYIKAVNGEGELLAIGEIRLPNLYHPILVL